MWIVFINEEKNSLHKYTFGKHAWKTSAFERRQKKTLGKKGNDSYRFLCFQPQIKNIIQVENF